PRWVHHRGRGSRRRAPGAEPAGAPGREPPLRGAGSPGRARDARPGVDPRPRSPSRRRHRRGPRDAADRVGRPSPRRDGDVRGRRRQWAGLTGRPGTLRATPSIDDHRAVRIAEFGLERYFARWEFAVRHLLCASDVEAWRLDDLLALADDETARLWNDLRLGYTESTGHPVLRAEIATLYESVGPEDVLVFAAGADAIDRGVSLGVMSKSFALAGLRIGWLASRDRDLLARCAAFKDYTTICSSAPAEILALIGLRARDRVLARSRRIVEANLPLLDRFFA